MAKRVVPEINAGSMADIAFLLLIFFLVTTTMDKDTAYLRKIPKKVESLVTPPPVEEKNIYKIVINSKQVIQARDSIIKPEDISTLNSRIKHFYLINRGKKTDRALNYPYYAYGSKELYSTNLNNQFNRLDALEAQEVQDDRTQKMIEQTTAAIDKWQQKLNMMNLYTQYSGKQEMPEIAFEAHIRLESFVDTDYSAYVAVQSEVQRAVTELRDEESEALFGVSWTTMNRYIQTNALEDTPELRQYKKHAELIETLYPLSLIEVKPKR
ncbi:ExbD/TolR family protein [Brumimicrobium mesophilum]|uniref:ExbD/TolR family protein n=1 Tax=Brumimicrobium mesophilum TaxID=392717 RepID=UPI000D14443E|nr:biopolymer transporter ExbD [Brumimicrobium mesophilum]